MSKIQEITKISIFHGRYKFLSNFYPAPIYYDDIYYPTTEHAYVATKTLNIATRKYISRILTPSSAKRFGKSVVKLREDWPEIRLQVMLDLTQLKYQIPKLKALLLSTGDLVLEEGNTRKDRFWGICPPNSGNGENHLGRIIMTVRNEIRESLL